MKDRQGYEIHEDGTRVGDTNLQRGYDRITGWANRNKTDVPEERNVFAGKGSVFETDPFFNPWAKGGTFNP